RQQHLAERLMRDGLQRALLIRGRAAGPDGELDREDADDPVDEAAGDESRTREPLERAAVSHVLAASPSCLNRLRLRWCLDAHGTTTCRVPVWIRRRRRPAPAGSAGTGRRPTT